MRKLVITLFVFLFSSTVVMAAKIPDDVTNFIKKDFPKAEIRFDGLITLENSLYLPLFPAKIKYPEKLLIKTTVPANKSLKNLPDIAVFNNDFVLMKIIENKDGKRTVLYQENPFEEVRTGLLPQDLLVPRGLIIPENIKTIIGGLKIATEQETLKVKSELVKDLPVVESTVKKDLVANIVQFKNKNMYVMTCHSKNIQVVPMESSRPEYALALNSLPVDLKIYDNKYLLVTTFGSLEMNVISLADDAEIKTFEFESQPEEIIIDNIHKKAFVTTPANSSIYEIDLTSMQMTQKLQVNGVCSKMYLTPDASKLIYVDKNTNDVWAIELNNDYELKEIGIFPNISAFAYSNNKIYITSRTKSRLAIIDYATLSLVNEMNIIQKPVQLFLYYGNLFVLGADKGVIQVLNTQTDKITHVINLGSKEDFYSNIYKLEGTNLALITSAKAGNYKVLNLDKKQVIKTLPLDIPVSKIVITNKVKKIND